jgi:hypothetical protein
MTQEHSDEIVLQLESPRHIGMRQGVLWVGGFRVRVCMRRGGSHAIHHQH